MKKDKLSPELRMIADDISSSDDEEIIPKESITSFNVIKKKAKIFHHCYIFFFQVEVTVGKKLWIELTYEILRQVMGCLNRYWNSTFKEDIFNHCPISVLS